ncbi:hypothetical protein [Virgisporangium aurantiacum]|uniref:Hsp70 protein n=1 Tax=Virgisporangium aurantiacum TaxID=175570 RepID=A0A8J4E5I9_9ACTN|nr:hypothetical protein [Virgisporangium aurantiacum]GIJ63115.1 hypothetical protein Vau01_106310 [Virgisporangium aurantiacum]
MTAVNAAWTRVGIDVGSATTVAVVCRTDGLWQPLTFDGQPWLRSGVYRRGTGPVLTGAQALAAAMADPAGYLPDPAGRISTAAVPLGDGTVPGVHLVGAVVRRVLDETERRCGGPLPEVVLVVPPGWGPPRRALLREAAQYAGVREPVLRPAAEAVAAHGQAIDVPVARWIVVCDLGARAAASVVRRTVTGYEVLAEIDGDAGGDRIDEVLAIQLATASTATASTATASTAPGAPPEANSTASSGVDSPTPSGASAQMPAGATPTDAWHDPTPVDEISDSNPHRTARTSRARPVAAAWAVRMTVRAAKEATASTPAVLIPAPVDSNTPGMSPGGVPQSGVPATGAMMVITSAQVQAAAAPVIDTATKLICQAVQAAEVPAETGCGLLLIGGTAAIPGTADRIQAGTGLATHALPGPALAAACAATNAGRYEPSPAPNASQPQGILANIRSTMAPTGPKPTTAVPSWSQLFAPLIPALASMLLAFHAVMSGYVENSTWAPDADRYLGINDGQLAMAAVLAVIASAAVGANYGPVLRPDQIPAGRQPPAGLPVAAGLLSGAGIGVAVAALYAGIGAAYHNGPFVLRLIQSTLVAAIPMAAIVAIAAYLIFRGAPEPEIGWGLALTVPHPPIVLATIAMAAITLAANKTYPPDFMATWQSAIFRCSGLLLGLATAYLIAERRRTQIISAIPLTVIMMLIASYNTAKTLATIWIVSLACWWIRRTWQIGAYGIPNDRRHANR